MLENRLQFITDNPTYSFLLEFLANGAETLVKAKELISGLDLLKMFQKQLGVVIFENDIKTGSEVAMFQSPEVQTFRDTYYGFLQKWFDRLMDLTQLYCETGLEMVQKKAAQTKGFQESDFLSERDQLMYKNLKYSRAIRVVAGDATEMVIKNTMIRTKGLPEMHLRHGKLLMRFQDMGKARHCFVYGQDSFELAKFLYFYQKAHHTAAEYELVLVKTLLVVLNHQLFINAKPGAYRGQRGDKCLKLKIGKLSDEETATVKVRALNYAKEVFHYYLAITRLFLLRDGQANTTRFFKQQQLLKYCNFYLVLLEELLRQEDTVPAESSFHFNTRLVRQMRRHFRLHEEPVLANDKDAERFLNFFGTRRDYAESLADAVNGEGKPYLLKVFHELRTNIYKPTIQFYRKVDRELDIDLMDRIFFVYFNDTVPQNQPDLFDDLDSPGFFEPAQTRQSQQPPNLFNMLLGGMAGGSSSGGGGGVPDAGNFMSFLNDFMQ